MYTKKNISPRLLANNYRTIYDSDYSNKKFSKISSRIEFDTVNRTLIAKHYDMLVILATTSSSPNCPQNCPQNKINLTMREQSPSM